MSLRRNTFHRLIEKIFSRVFLTCSNISFFFSFRKADGMKWNFSIFSGMMEREDVSIVKKKRKMYKTIKEINNENNNSCNRFVRSVKYSSCSSLWIFIRIFPWIKLKTRCDKWRGCLCYAYIFAYPCEFSMNVENLRLKLSAILLTW